MSITQETLQQHLKDPAIFCCRRSKGLVISAADLEDPTLFDDMEEAGLLTLSPDGLTIEQVLGATLLTDVEALTPITPAVLDHVNYCMEPEPVSPEPTETPLPVSPSSIVKTSTGGNGMLHIEIAKAKELEGFSLDIPLNGGTAPIPSPEAAPIPAPSDTTGEKTVIRTLKKQHIRITDVKIGSETKIENGVIYINEALAKEALGEDPLCKDIKLDVIYPDQRHVYTETIMDVCPIATKVEGELGEGIRRRSLHADRCGRGRRSGA